MVNSLQCPHAFFWEKNRFNIHWILILLALMLLNIKFSWHNWSVYKLHSFHLAWAMLFTIDLTHEIIHKTWCVHVAQCVHTQWWMSGYLLATSKNNCNNECNLKHNVRLLLNNAYYSNWSLLLSSAKNQLGHLMRFNTHKTT